MVSRWSVVVLSLGVLGCDAARPTDRALAESVGVTLVACLPRDTSATTSPVVAAIEAQLVVGGERIVAGLPLDRAAIDCLYAAGADCDAARACLGVEFRAVPACGLEQPHCSIGHLVSCREERVLPRPFRVAIDCAAHGLVCVQHEELPGACAVGLCPVGETTTVCSDAQTIETCTNGALLHEHCGPGTVCVAAAAACVGAGAPCVADACADGMLLRCDATSGRTLPPENCAATGRTCSSVAPGGPGCVPRGERDCDPRVGGAEDCIGDTLVYCGIDAQLRHYDCVAHGYLGCDDGRSSCIAAEPAL